MGRAVCFHPMFLLLALLVILAASPAAALPEYAEATGRPCVTCHIDETGGGGLTADGRAYLADPAPFARKDAPSGVPRSAARRLTRLVLLYLHVFFGIIWVGTILYVHLVLKPKYAIGGLPRSELRLAWISMPLITVTGSALTWLSWSSFPNLFGTRYGIILLVKAGVFFAMFASATFVTLFVGPRLRRIARGAQGIVPAQVQDLMTSAELAFFDGKEGRKALVAVDGVVYDVSASRLWKDGSHVKRHRAGGDLSGDLAQAPHGREVLDRVPAAAKLVLSAVSKPMVVRLFVFNAYFNLAGCFVIILCLVLWRV